MAKFCGKCGAELDKEVGLCPICDSEQLSSVKSTFKFCTVCGCVMDQTTGTCPNCSKAEDAAAAQEQFEETTVILPAAETVPLSEVTPMDDTAFSDVAEVDSVPLSAVATAEPVASAPTAPAKKKSSALTVILTVLVCLFLFLTTVMGTVIVVARRSTTEDGALKLLEEMEIVETINRLNETAVNNKADEDNEDKKSDDEKFIDNLNDYLLKKAGFPLTERELEELIEDSTIKEFLAEKIALYCEDLYEGNDSFSLRKRDVVELLEDNERVIRREFKTSVPDDIFEDLANWLVDDDAIEQMSVEKLKENMPVAYYALHIGLSYFTVAFLVLLVLLCIFAMIKNSPSQAACGAGITFTVIGAVFSIAALIALWLPSLWETMCAESLIGTILGIVLYNNIMIYVIIFAVGVLTLIARAVVPRLLSKRAKQVKNA